jgi:hypothetical protein
MDHITTHLEARRTSLAQPSTNSIEVSVCNTNNASIELPEEIESLITGSDYWKTAKRNRYKKLVREGHLSKLLHLAEEALTRDNPDHWFARACSVKYWESRTLPYLGTLAKVQTTAVQVADKLSTAVTLFIYRQIWNGVNVERWADMAREMPHDKPGQSKVRHFAWLCRRELAGRMAAVV